MAIFLKGLVPQKVDDSPVQCTVAECDLSHKQQTESILRYEIVLQKEILECFDVCKLLDSMNSLPHRLLLSLQKFKIFQLLVVTEVFTQGWGSRNQI